MSAADLVPAVAPSGAGHAHDDHDGHGHQPHLAHHFESYEQQFDAGKLGIWLFLVTEVLFFSGLFCAYVVFRVIYPEIFAFGHLFLNKQLGAVNTVVLLVSSLTMALAVRSAQLGQRKLLIGMLIATIACALVFMGIKYVEYTSKFQEGLFPGTEFKPTDEALLHAAHLMHGAHGTAGHGETGHGEAAHAEGSHGETGHGEASHGDAHAADAKDEHGFTAADRALIETTRKNMPQNPNPGLFFSIYFCLTGLHGIHIIGGIAAISWILYRSIQGHFTPLYFGPVEYVGLYWHLVDLIWIYLFPLLYLIH